jgi:hypothetical protein
MVYHPAGDISRSDHPGARRVESPQLNWGVRCHSEVSVRASSIGDTPRHTTTAGAKIVIGIVAALALILLSLGVLFYATLGQFVEVLQTAFTRGDGCAGCRALPTGTAVARHGRAVAQVTQVAEPNGTDRPLPMYLSRGSGPVLDSLLAGRLVARLDPSKTAAEYIPLIELVSPDSVSGRTIVARLVVADSPGPVPVFEDPSISPR